MEQKTALGTQHIPACTHKDEQSIYVVISLARDSSINYKSA